jgi:hypothetical protein
MVLSLSFFEAPLGAVSGSVTGRAPGASMDWPKNLPPQPWLDSCDTVDRHQALARSSAPTANRHLPNPVLTHSCSTFLGRSE